MERHLGLESLRMVRGGMSKIPELSVILLTRNGVQELSPFLPELTEVTGEVILWDDFSDDDIESLAKRVCAKYFQHRLENDFAAHRNAALEKAQKEWVLFLDQDERPQPGFWEELEKVLQKPEYDTYFIRRETQFLGKVLQHGETGSVQILRLARKSVGKGKWRRPVHEIWEIEQKTGLISTPILHLQPTSFTEFLVKLHHYASQEPASRSKYGMARILFELFTFPLGKFLYNYFFKQGFLDGFPGFALAVCMSYYSLLVRVFLYETRQRQ